MDERISKERVLGELAAIAFACAGDYLQVQSGVLEVTDTQQLTASQQAAIAAVEKGSGGVKVKFYDKLKALELLGKALGLFEGGAAEQQENNLLEAILQATEEEVDTDDLPEVQ